MEPNIIVTGRPYAVFETEAYLHNMPSAIEAGLLVQSQMAGQETVVIDPEVTGEDIVVVGKRLKEEVTKIAVVAAINGNGGAVTELPCIGEVPWKEISAVAKHLQFNVSNRQFGPGRAGENLAGSDGDSVPVNINAQALLDYSQLTNGISYVVAHEIAHALYKMQQYDNANWNAYVARMPEDWSTEQLKAEYYTSQEFLNTEMRANTIARAIAQAFQSGEMIPPPTYGYQVC